MLAIVASLTWKVAPVATPEVPAVAAKTLEPTVTISQCRNLARTKDHSRPAEAFLYTRHNRGFGAETGFERLGRPMTNEESALTRASNSPARADLQWLVEMALRTLLPPGKRV